jgi:uncharacterized membrane protein
MFSDRLTAMPVKVRENLPIFIICLVAFLIRMFSIGSMSLSNDELSSICRSVMQPTWHDMIVNGVMTDGHPPLTYILMRFWGPVVGTTPLGFRLPFVLASILALYYTYLTGRIWFGRTTALLAVSFLAVITYAIYYSQIIRPYALGMLWVQAAVYYWSMYFLDPDAKGRKVHLMLWAIMAILSCYTHYFSMMAVGFVGVTGLLFCDRRTIVYYLLSGLLILSALIPGRSIFRQQLSYGGLDWLGRPDRSWFGEYLMTSFNHSPLLYVLVGLLLVASIGVFFYTGRKPSLKLQVIGVIWFMASFLIGYYKSVYGKPVLQTSCLYFTYPFLLLVLFSFWGESAKAFAPILVLVILVAGVYDTVWGQKYYETEHHGEIKDLTRQMAVWTDRYGSDMVRAVNLNNKYYWDYYWVGTLHRSEPVSMYSLEQTDEIHQLDSIVTDSKTGFFAVAWSNKGTPDTIFKIIERRYPHLIESPAHFNSGIRLYSR